MLCKALVAEDLDPALDGGLNFAHLLDIGLIHFLEVTHVLEKDIDVHNVIEIGVNRLKHHLERVQDLFGLRCNICACQLTRGGIHTRCAANGDERPNLGDVVIWSAWRGWVGWGGWWVVGVVGWG